MDRISQDTCGTTLACISKTSVYYMNALQCYSSEAVLPSTLDNLQMQLPKSSFSQLPIHQSIEVLLQYLIEFEHTLSCTVNLKIITCENGAHTLQLCHITTQISSIRTKIYVFSYFSRYFSSERGNSENQSCLPLLGCWSVCNVPHLLLTGRDYL